MSWTKKRLQNAVNTFMEHGEYKAAKMLGLRLSSLERLLREAKAKGIIPTEETPEPKKPNVLILDIETSLMSFYGWSPGEQYVGPDQIITDWHVISWAAKWLFEPDVYSEVITQQEAIEKDDKRVIEAIWKFIDAADILIIHNARFDVRKLNARFMYYRMPPPSPYIVIDTLKIVRREALFSSNKQGQLAKTLQIKDKLEHEGYQLWVKCFNGDKPSLLKMQEYNIGDILSLEELYTTIRPYIKNHPNMNLFVEGSGSQCPNCGGEDIRWMDKFYYTSVNKYSCFRCADCGAVGRSRESAISKEDRVRIASISR